MKSTGTRIIGDHLGGFEEGELYLLGPNLPHRFHNVTLPRGGAEAEVLQFSREGPIGHFASAPECQVLDRLIENARFGMVFPPDKAGPSGAILPSIRRADGLRRLSLFFELILEIVEAGKGVTLASPGYAGFSPSPASERIHQACLHILGHFTEDLSHDAVARKVHMAPASFSRLFRRATRKTYTQFLTEVRLGHACRLLIETSHTVASTAHASGFQNLSNFNRRFRQRYGCSPRQYRHMSD